jgi:hypothetical protein
LNRVYMGHCQGTPVTYINPQHWPIVQFSCASQISQVGVRLPTDF